MKKKHLVTGGAGLIGFEITKQLLEAGDQVVVIDRYSKGGQKDLEQLQAKFSSQLQRIQANLLDPLKGVLPDGPYDTVFHLAAIVGVKYVDEHPYETLRSNTITTLNLIDFCIEAGCQGFVFASSSENYASGVDRGWISLPTPEEVPLVVGDIKLPRWSYAVSKIAGESAVFGAAPLGKFSPYVIRFHNVYGPRMALTHVIPEILDRCAKKMDPMPVYGYDMTRSFLYVEDAARAVRLITESPKTKKGGVFNVGSSEEITIQSLLELIFDVTQFHPKLDIHSAPPGSVKRRVANTDQIQSLGFRPKMGLRNGLAACWDHIHGPSKKP